MSHGFPSTILPEIPHGMFAVTPPRISLLISLGSHSSISSAFFSEIHSTMSLRTPFGVFRHIFRHSIRDSTIDSSRWRDSSRNSFRILSLISLEIRSGNSPKYSVRDLFKDSSRDPFTYFSWDSFLHFLGDLSHVSFRYAFRCFSPNSFPRFLHWIFPVFFRNFWWDSSRMSRIQGFLR